MSFFSIHPRRCRGAIEKSLLKYLIPLGILVAIALGMLGWSLVTGGEEIAGEERSFYCYFDETEVRLSNREVNQWKVNGDAIFPYDRRNEPPTRLRCPECNRLSCIEPDAKTGEVPELSAAWEALLDTTDAGGAAPSRIESN